MRRSKPETVISPARTTRRQAFGNWDSQFTSKRRDPILPSPTRPPSAYSCLSPDEVDKRFQQLNYLHQHGTGVASSLSPLEVTQGAENLPPRSPSLTAPYAMEKPRGRPGPTLSRPSPTRRPSYRAGSVGRCSDPGGSSHGRRPASECDLGPPSLPRHPRTNSRQGRRGPSSNAPETSSRIYPHAPSALPPRRSYSLTREHSTSIDSTTYRRPEPPGLAGRPSSATGHEMRKRPAPSEQSQRSQRRLHQTCPTPPRYHSNPPVDPITHQVGNGQPSTLTPDVISSIDRVLRGLFGQVEFAFQTLRPSSSSPQSVYPLDELATHLLDAKDWSAQMDILKLFEESLDYMMANNCPPMASRLPRVQAQKLVELFNTLGSSPRSHLAKKTLTVLHKLLVVQGQWITYSAPITDVLPQLFLKKSQEHIHPAFITTLAKKAFLAWVVFSPPEDVLVALDRILGSGKIQNISLALLGAVCFVTRNVDCRLELWPNCRNMIYGLKTILNRGKRHDRRIAEIVLFLILEVGAQRDLADSHDKMSVPLGRRRTLRSPHRPRASIPDSVKNLSWNIEVWLTELETTILREMDSISKL